MENKVLNFGVIGCGVISEWHAKAIADTPKASLVGVTDVREQARADFAKNHGVAEYESIDALLSDPNIDAVCLCTPSGLHAPLAIQAAKMGKHVVVEKPMALNLEEANAVIEACERNNVKLTVISQLRFSPDVIKLKEIVDSGVLGKVVSGGIRMKYHRSQEYYDASAWRGTWKMDGGGAIMNQGIHGVDLLLHIMGPAKSVFAMTRTLVRSIEVEDTAVSVVEFANGAIGTIEATSSVYPGFLRYLEICGSEGSVILEEDKITYCKVKDKDFSQYVKKPSDCNALASNPRAIKTTGHILQISDFTDAVLNDRKPIVDAYEGRRAVKTICAMYESSKTGKLFNISE